MKEFAVTLVVIVMLVALSFGISYAKVHWWGVIKTKTTEIDRKVVEESRSYNEAKVQQLAKYKREYDKGDADTKKAIEATVRATCASYDADRLPGNLKYFLIQCRGY